ncbi:MAG: RNA polymerase factor sigma-54 [Bacillota bacterium]|nr:RNA polymerase factor sigma-54 [Bacillota bacterium]
MGNDLLLKQEQKQILSPALIQSLKLLLLPSMEFAAYLEEQLTENPVLELEEDAVEPPRAGAEQAEPYRLLSTAAGWTEHESWDGGGYYGGDDTDDAPLPQFGVTHQHNSLQQMLLLQLAMSGCDEQTAQAARAIIAALDDDGYLRLSTAELAAYSGRPETLFKQALTLVQGLEPAGVAARDLAECMLLQLDKNAADYPLYAAIINGHLTELATDKRKQVARQIGVSEDKVAAAFAYLRGLDPHPAAYGGDDTQVQYIIPDIVVRKAEGGYQVFLNDKYHPRLRISSYYRDLSGDALNSNEVKEYIQQRINAAAMLLRNIERRHQTIYKLACIVVDKQRGFLDHGLEQLQPLTLREVAELAELHESTVSRAICGKYIETPRGVYPWKFFFPRAYTSDEGDSVSAVWVKSLISELIAGEDKRRPLSDRQIEEKLAERGVSVARRTVAKYRGSMNIPKQSYRRRG